MKKLLSLIIVLAWLAVSFPVQAQSETPYVVDSTTPISSELRAALDAWLATDPPSDAMYYIVTYVQPEGAETLVSLAGVNLTSPEADWSLEEGSWVWLGSVRVLADGSVEPFSVSPSASRGLLLRPAYDGGGSYVAFPFYNSAQYGPRGVHGSGDYGTSGMLAVDLVGGDNMGVSSMPPQAIASDDGEVDYVCDDGTSVAVRTHNSSTGDYFVYAHMLDNANLTLGHEFAQGALIGALKYGSFDDTCGWAEQQTNHYHLHWMFTPSGGTFQAGACILTVSTQKWQCGSQTISTGQFLAGGGGYSGTPGEDDGGASAVYDPTFWDYVLGGIIALVDSLFVSVLPEHGSSEIIYVFFNTIEMVFRLARILVFQSINIYPIIFVLGVVIAFRLLLSLVFVALVLLRAWKQLVPVIGA